MNSKVAILTFVAIIAAVAAEKKYTNKFDNVNVDSVLGNDRILNSYIKCLMDKGSCTAEGRELKKLLPDALQSDCSKCTDVQKKNSRKVINHLRSHRAGDWKLLLDKYDPKGNYRARYENH